LTRKPCLRDYNLSQDLCHDVFHSGDEQQRGNVTWNDKEGQGG
jgi:hypothetical protein